HLMRSSVEANCQLTCVTPTLTGRNSWIALVLSHSPTPIPSTMAPRIAHRLDLFAGADYEPCVVVVKPDGNFPRFLHHYTRLASKNALGTTSRVSIQAWYRVWSAADDGGFLASGPRVSRAIRHVAGLRQNDPASDAGS